MSVNVSKSPEGDLLVTSKYHFKRMTPQSFPDEMIAWANTSDVINGLNISPNRALTRFDIVRRVKKFTQPGFYMWEIVTKDGKPVGYTTITPSTKKEFCSLELVIGEPNYYGKQIPEHCALAVFEFMFNYTDCLKITARIVAYNTSSIAAAMRMGMTIEALERQSQPDHQGGWCDTAVLGVLKSEWPAIKQQGMGFRATSHRLKNPASLIKTELLNLPWLK